MTVLKREISKRVKGSLAEREDWWRLCYDTDTREFYVEHEWHHSDAYNVRRAADEGTTRADVNGYSGAGSDKIEGAMAALLEEAGHA